MKLFVAMPLPEDFNAELGPAVRCRRQPSTLSDARADIIGGLRIDDLPPSNWEQSYCLDPTTGAGPSGGGPSMLCGNNLGQPATADAPSAATWSRDALVLS